MAVNVELFNVRVGGGVGRHGAVSGFIRVVIIVKVMCFCRIDFLADGFGKVNKLMENKLDIIEEIQLKASDLRSVWNFVKPTELTKVPGIVKEYQKQGVCRD